MLHRDPASLARLVSDGDTRALAGRTVVSEATVARRILTPSDHGLILHDGGRGFITIAQRVSGRWQERGVQILDLEYFLRHLDPAIDSYISQNRFWLPCRRIAYLVQADALFTDLDYYATELRDRSPRYIFEHALMLLDEANIPPPTFATATGRGVALVWLHTPNSPPGSTPLEGLSKDDLRDTEGDWC